jgi:hypothetical protein
MSDWAWVGLGYSVVYGSIGAYAIFLTRRLRIARRRLERQQ